MKTEKVYDFKMAPVKTKVVAAFKKRKNESSIADLIAVTGLPKYQVEQASRAVLEEYRGQVKATESGEILYYFPQGMRSTVRGFVPGMKKFFKAFMDTLRRVLTFLFKVWIMLMLVAYFVLFLVILVAAVVAAVAAQASSRSSNRSRSRGGGGGALFLVLRLVQAFLRIFFWVNLTRAMDGKTKPRTGRPFYKSVFAFVFGDEDPNRDWEEREKIRIISFIRTHKGVITTEEVMALTGRDYLKAQQILNSYLVEFEGEPMVTDEGTLFYFFPELLRTQKKELLLADEESIEDVRYKKLIPFTNNKGKSNALIGFFNTFNLAFGAYFFIFSLIGITAASEIASGFVYTFLYQEILQFYLEIPSPAMLIFIVLGIIPLSFSVLFFLVALVRKVRLARRNEQIKRENLEKKIYSTVMQNPVQLSPGQIKSVLAADSPKNVRQFIEEKLNILAGQKNAEFEKTESDSLLYHFNEIKRERDDIEKYRSTVDLSKYEVGETVFDSGE